MRLPRRSLLLAAFAAALVPATAEADTVVSKPDAETILVQNIAATEDNVLEVDLNAGTFTVTENDPAYALALGSGTASCSTVSPTSVTCPAAGVTRVRVYGGPGDDQLSSVGAVRRELYGEAGDDYLAGDIAGELLVGGTGIDTMWGEGGNDRLDASDGNDDFLTDCGSGEDDLDGDWDDSYGPGCEVVAPEIQGSQTISSNPVYALSGLWADGQLSTMNADVRWRWYRCSGPSSCVVVHDDPVMSSYFVRESDVGHTLYFEVFASNRAGSASLRSNASPVVQPALVPSFPPPDYYADPLAGLTTPTVDRRALTRTLLDGQLGTAAKALRRVKLRALARRRRVPLALAFPEKGTLDLAVTVPAKTARKYGVRGRKPVTLAKGRARGEAGAAAAVELVLTKHGRRIVGRAKSLDTTLAATLTTGRKDVGTVKSSQRVKLKRR